MKKILLIILVASASLLSAIVANHIPPEGFKPDQQTELRVEVIQGLSDVVEAMIMYRLQGADLFESIRLEKEGLDNYWMRGNIPATTAADKGYEYFFRFTLADNTVETLPQIEPESQLFLILPDTKNGTLSEDFIMLSDQQSVAAKDGYILAVSWYALEGLISKESIKVFVNDKDVTRNAVIGTNMLIYKDKSPKLGVTTAYVTAVNNVGKELYSKTWTTVVKSSGKITNLPLNMRGSLNAGTNIYAIANDEQATTFGSDTDDGWASLDMYGDYEKLKLQTYAYLSTLQKEDMQNINRFRMGILLPFWDTYLGDYTPTMSNLTMNNRNLRGVYTKLHSKHFGLSFAHGEMVRPVKGDEILDPVTREVTYKAGTFKQEALAARMQLGSENGFLVGFTTTRNRDIVSSLDSKYIVNITETDTTQFAFPKDNIVQSMDMRIRIPSINFTIGMEGAGSLFNRNTYWGPLNTDEIEEYFEMDEGDEFPVNPVDFQDIFIINTNMEPLPISGNLESLTSVVAWQAYLRNQVLDNLLNISYSRVGESYHALSSGYLQSDAEQWQLSDQYHYKQLFFLSGGVNQTKDNVSKSKLDTNIYDNFYLSGLFRLPRYPFLTLSYTDNKGMNELNDEIILSEPDLFTPYKRSSNLFSMGLGYELAMIPYAPSSVEIGWRTGTSISRTEASGKALTKQYEYKTNNVSLGVVSRFAEIPLKTQIAISNSIQDITLVDDKNNTFSFMLRGDYRLLDNLLYPWSEYKLISLSGYQPKQSYNYLTLGVDVHPLELTRVSTNLGWRFYDNSDLPNADYTTTYWHLDISQRF